MKKLLLVICMCLFIGTVFASCTRNVAGWQNTDDTSPDNSPGTSPEDTHTCIYDQKIENDDFLKNEANCTQRKTYYYSCQCGKAGTETFSVGGYGHVLENGKCINTGCDYRESVGLDMYPTTNKTGYSCSIGDCTDQHVIIPEYYNGLPVVEINDCGWSYAETVTIPHTVTLINSRMDNVSRIYYQGTLAEWLNMLKHDFLIGTEIYIDGKLITDVVVPEGTQRIGSAFNNWRWLKSIHIPASVDNINISNIQGNLESITVDERNKTYRSDGNCLIKNDTVIAGCNTSVIPDDGSITRIGDWAFYNCDGLRTITLPSSVETIGQNAFAACDGLESIIGLGVKSRGQGAFYSCESLKSYTFHSDFNDEYMPTMPSTVIGENDIQIGDYVFRIVDETPTLVGYVGTESKLTLPQDYQGNAYVIGEKAFYGNNEIYEIVIPDTVTKIESKAFSNCNFLFNVTLGSGLTEIADDAFVDSYRLVEVYNRSSLTVNVSTYGLAQAINIYDNADGSLLYYTDDGYVFYLHFYHTYLLGYIGDDIRLNLPTTIPTPNNGLQSNQARLYYTIHDYAFYECNDVVSVDVPALAAFLGKYAFYGCDSLQKIEFHGDVMGIGDKALYDCPELKILHLPASLANVGEDAFDVNDLVALYFDGDVNDWAKINFSSPILERQRYNIYLDNVKLFTFQNIVLSDNLKQIGSYAFAYWNNLKTIDTGNGVLSIGENAFYGTHLRTVTLGSKVLTIYDDAFHYVDIIFNYSGLNISKGEISENGGISRYTDIITRQSSIVKGDFVFVVDTEGLYHLVEYTGTQINISLPDNCDGHNYSIYNEVFSGLPIESIYIGSSVTEIGKGAFGRCSELITLSFASNGNLVKIGERAFIGCRKLTTITLPSSLKAIENGAFEIGDHDTYVNTTINAHITDIGSWLAMRNTEWTSERNCTLNLYMDGNLITELTIPEGTTNIPDYAFRGCVNLTSINIPNSVTYIGHCTFQGCVNLTSINIPNSVTTIESFAFADCTGLTTINIPDSVTHIGYSAFENCSGLRQHENGVYYIDKWAVDYDENAASITLRSDTVGIAEDAFFNNDNIVSIVIPSNVKVICGDVFYMCDNLSSVIFEEITNWNIDSSKIADAAYMANYLTDIHANDVVRVEE